MARKPKKDFFGSLINETLGVVFGGFSRGFSGKKQSRKQPRSSNSSNTGSYRREPRQSSSRRHWDDGPSFRSYGYPTPTSAASSPSNLAANRPLRFVVGIVVILAAAHFIWKGVRSGDASDRPVSPVRLPGAYAISVTTSDGRSVVTGLVVDGVKSDLPESVARSYGRWRFDEPRGLLWLSCPDGYQMGNAKSVTGNPMGRVDGVGENITVFRGRQSSLRLICERAGLPTPQTPDPTDPPLVAALHVANFARALQLLDNGTDVNAPSEADSDTPLIAASKRGHVQIVQKLLAKGANVNARDAWGQTSLKWAATLGHADVVRALLTAGADPNIADQNGVTPLAGAQMPDHRPMPEIVELLQFAKAK